METIVHNDETLPPDSVLVGLNKDGQVVIKSLGEEPITITQGSHSNDSDD